MANVPTASGADTTSQVRRASRQRTPEDTPGCIKLVILGFLLVLLAAELAVSIFSVRSADQALSVSSFGQINPLNWILVALTLLLIALIGILIRV